jgi:YegS/Rv2252/BmrU family lipid kinase
MKMHKSRVSGGHKKVHVLLNRIRRAIPFHHRTKKRVCVILNPSAGQERPTLKILNQVFHHAGYEWDIEITNTFGDGKRLAQKAIASGVDAVAVYGGDGSIMDVAGGMINSGIPLAVLPGGTGNVLAVELGIPRDLRTACELVVHSQRKLRPIDAGAIGKQVFLLRLSLGLEATVIELASRELKDHLGILAYGVAFFQSLGAARASQYEMLIDGTEVKCEGLDCIIANAGNLGLPGVDISPNISIDDGLLDVYVIRKVDLDGIISLAAHMVGSKYNIESMPHWRCREISVSADPVQSVQADGDVIGNSPVQVKILPGALKMVVPDYGLS